MMSKKFRKFIVALTATAIMVPMASFGSFASTGKCQCIAPWLYDEEGNYREYDNDEDYGFEENYYPEIENEFEDITEQFNFFSLLDGEFELDTETTYDELMDALYANYDIAISEDDDELLRLLYEASMALMEAGDYDNPTFFLDQFEDIMKEYLGEALPDEEMSPVDEPVENPTGEEAKLNAIYKVVNNKLVLSTDAKDYPAGKAPQNLTKKEKEMHQKLWAHVNKIMPKDVMKFIGTFEVGTDGKGGVLAHVTPLKENLVRWTLNLDLKDAFKENGSFNQPELNDTIVHEFGHVLTLNSTQMESKRNEKAGTYTTSEGTTKAKSYLNLFYSKYWKANEKQYSTGENRYNTEKLYADHPEWFVSDYAATNPEEDMAEAFRVFVLKDKPSGKKISDDKVKFYYQFAELVKIRTEIRKGLGLK